MPDFSKLKAGDPVAIYSVGNLGRRMDVKKWSKVTTVTRNTGRRLYVGDGWHYNFDGSCADPNRTARLSIDPDEIASASQELAAEAQKQAAFRAEQDAFAQREDVKLANEILGWDTSEGIEAYLRVGEEKLRAFAQALREANPS